MELKVRIGFQKICVTFLSESPSREFSNVKMVINLRWSWLFLVFLWRIVVTEQTRVEQSLYRIVEAGEKITGIISAEIRTKTELQCSLRFYDFLQFLQIIFIAEI